MNIVNLATHNAVNQRQEAKKAKIKNEADLKRKKSLKEQGRKKVGVNDIKIEMSDDEDESSMDSQIKKTLLANNSSSAIDRKLKVSAMNELEKYKEI